MTDLFVDFNPSNKADTWPTLFINRDYPTQYTCDGVNGIFTFNGYYNVENHPPPYPEDEGLQIYERPYRYLTYLPKLFDMYVKTTDEEHYYRVEIFKKEIHKNTDKYSIIESDDGSEMQVCFFPTDKQTLHFKILETLK